MIIKTVQAINASDIPKDLEDACWDIDCEFPFHYDTKLICIEDEGNPFVEWLKSQGYQFPDNEHLNGIKTGWLGVWGT